MGCGASSKAKYKEDGTDKQQGATTSTAPPTSSQSTTSDARGSTTTDGVAWSTRGTCESSDLRSRSESFSTAGWRGSVREIFSSWETKDSARTSGSGAAFSSEQEDVDVLPDDYLASDRMLAMRRNALSADAHGDWNQFPEFKPEVVPKTDEQAGRIKDAMLKSPILRPLAARREDLQIAISAFRHVEVKAGDEVITQGAPGTDLFLLESGILDVYVRSSRDQPHPGAKVATFDRPGQEFGELALLHNAPRQATVVAREPAALWCLSRNAFNTVMVNNTKLRHERHMGFLRSVKLLEPLSVVQIARISDACATAMFSKGEFVCREGDIGDCFYMVEEGEAMARINGLDVRSYKRGGYFGELSLINDRPRAADIVAASDELHVVSLDRDSFTRLLGDKALFNRASLATAEVPFPVGQEKKRKSVTFATSGGVGFPEPPAKPVKRGTGFIDRAKLIELLDEAGEGEDDDDEDGEDEATPAEPPKATKKVGFDASPGEGVPKKRKQGTGYIHADQLAKILQEIGTEDEEDEEKDVKKVQFDAGPAEGAPKVKKKGTGFIHAEQLKKLLAEIPDDEIVDEPEEVDDSRKVQFDSADGVGETKPPKKRGTDRKSVV